MKRLYLALVLISVAATACGPGRGSAQTETESVQRSTSSATATQAPSYTPITATSMPVFVRDGTPLPPPNEMIQPQNISRLVEIARWGKGPNVAMLESGDEKMIYSLTTLQLVAYSRSEARNAWKLETGTLLSAITVAEELGIVALGDELGHIWILDRADGEVLQSWQSNQARIQALSIDSKNQRLGLLASDGNIKVWDIAGETLFVSLKGDRYSDHLALSDQSVLVWSTGTIEGIDLASGQSKFLYDEADVKVLNDDLFLINQYGEISLHNTLDGSEIASLAIPIEGELFPYSSTASISPNGNYIAIGSYESLQVTLWNLQTGNWTLLDSHSLEMGTPSECMFGDGYTPFHIYGTEFSSDGRVLTTHSGIGVSESWSLPDGRFLSAAPTAFLRAELPLEPGGGMTVLFSPNSQWLASGSYVWNMRTGMLENQLALEIVDFSADSTKLFATGDRLSDEKDYRISVFSLPAFEFDYEIELEDGPFFSLCGMDRMFVDSSSGYLFTTFFDGIAEIRDESGRLLEPELLGLKIPRGFAFADDGRSWVASVYEGLSIHLASGASELLPLELRSDIYDRSITISRTGSWVGWATYNDYAVLWNLTGPRPVSSRFEAHEDSYLTVAAISPDGSLFTAGGDDQIYIWDVQSGDLLLTLSTMEGINDLAFSPDGLYLAAVSRGVVQVWGIR